MHLLAAAPAAAQTAPSVPQNVTVTPGNAQLNLSWQAPSSWGTWNANSFEIQWKFSSAVSSAWFKVEGNGVTDGFTDSNTATSFVFDASQRDSSLNHYSVTNGTAYDLRIRAESKDPNADGSQPSHFRYSSWVTLSNLVPGVPAKTTGLAVTAGAAKLDLTWTAPANNGSAITGYDVHYKTSAAADQTGTGSDPTTGWVAASHSGTAASGSITSLTNGTAYDVRVRAKNTHGAGKWSDAQSGTPEAPSSNANLSGLTASSSASVGGTYSALDIGTFSASTTSYTATVSNAVTHAKLTPTVADTGKATVTVQGTDVSSGSASDAIALSEGANALTVRVTAQDTTTTKDYTVTITREARPQLTGLTLSAGGSAVTLSPAFAGTTINYTATVPHDATSVVVTPTWTGSLNTDVSSWTPNWAATITSLINLTSSGGSATVNLASSGNTWVRANVYTASLSQRNYRVTVSKAPPPPTVSLSASPNPVGEGASVTITARLSAALGSAVTIPLRLTDDSAEPSDHGALSSIRINSGATSGTGMVSTSQDADTDDETFTVALDTANLPAAVTAGSPASVQVTIRDDDGGAVPAVSLSAAPNPVDEGSSVTITARLSAALGSAVTIPLRLTDDSAEPSDHGTLASITVGSNQTSGTGTIATNHDADEDDERFTVALGNLPASVTAGSPASVQVRIRDDDGGEPPVGETAGASGAVELEPEPLQLALWTDKPGYRAGETVRLFHTLDPRDDAGLYRVFAWLEPAGGGQRRYLAPLSAEAALHARAVDITGLPERSARARLLPRADKAPAWEGESLAPGRWRFVLELRPGAADGQAGEPSRVRRAYAAFTVAARGRLLNRRGFDREVAADLTLRSDTLHYLGHQLFVQAGATLTIEPGTVVLAWGRHAAIIVEPGGRLVAAGTRAAPVVLTCSAPVGQREPGCWGGLRILGRAPVTRLEDVAPGVLPAARPVYGGTDAEDSSGVLRHVRVEFAGAGSEEGAALPAIGLYGAGSGTVLDRVQARASLGDGFAFSGGTAVCGHCVASGSGAAGLAWQRGWRGGAAQLYVQHGAGGVHGLDGGHDERGHDLEPRSLPTLSNVTLVHSRSYDRRAHKAVALRLSSGSGVRARDLLAAHFRGGAIEAGGRSALLFHEGASAVTGALLRFNGPPQLRGGIQDAVEYVDHDPQLRDVRWFANPDPRPKPGSPALPDEGGYIGAFGTDENWLEQWTVFGAEQDYSTAPAQ